MKDENTSIIMNITGQYGWETLAGWTDW